MHELLAGPYRRPLLRGLALLGFGLLVPFAVWLTIPGPRPQLAAPRPTATPQIIRVGNNLDEPIPATWRPPDLNPELQAQVLAIADTLPLTETAQLSETLPLMTAPYTPSNVGLVAAPALNLRDGPGGGYIPLQTLKDHSLLTLVGQHGGWFQVVTEGEILGWVDASFVATTAQSTTVPFVSEIPPVAPALIGVVDPATSGANLRLGPSRDSESLGVLRPGAGSLELLARFEDWYNVRTPKGSVGWVAAELIDTSAFIKRRVPIMRAAPRALEAVRLARQHLGVRYVWGGETPRQGFDCSGLVLYVYGKLGLELPHSAAAQYSTRFGAKITNQANLRPGDIVFFKNTYKRGISHVGIYAGKRLFIQAVGKNVSVGGLDEAYWAAHYAGAIRPFP